MNLGTVISIFVGLTAGLSFATALLSFINNRHLQGQTAHLQAQDAAIGEVAREATEIRVTVNGRTDLLISRVNELEAQLKRINAQSMPAIANTDTQQLRESMAGVHEQSTATPGPLMPPLFHQPEQGKE